VQEKVSPTYAEPKAGGSVRSGERMKASFFVDGLERPKGPASWRESSLVKEMVWEEVEDAELRDWGETVCLMLGMERIAESWIYLSTLRLTECGSLTESTVDEVR
jgi:hypothetical protein